jgi:uncharacterized protein YxjI
MQFPLQYPLTISFKIVALAPQLSVRDANGNLIVYVRQKLFKLKEAITVYADESQTQPLYAINADRILDFSARYNFTAQSGQSLGSIKRDGMRSLWKSHYQIDEGNPNTPTMSIQEENAWIKVIDSIVGEIPVLGLLTGYLFHPAYLVTRSDGTLVARIEKQPAFFEGKFLLENKAPVNAIEEQSILLSTVMMLLLERDRG